MRMTRPRPRRAGRFPVAAALGLALAIGSLPARADDDAPRRLHEWVDEEGVVHLTLGPSPQARARSRKLDVTPKGRSSAQPRKQKVRDTAEYDAHIEAAARMYKIPAELVRAVIVAESNFDPKAVSHAGAQGLMQLMPATAVEMYCHDSFDPVQNIYGGTRYLRVLANMFDGDIVKTVAAYNAGPNAVRRAGGIPRFAETQEYVRRVIRLYRIYKGLD